MQKDKLFISCLKRAAVIVNLSCPHSRRQWQWWENQAAICPPAYDRGNNPPGKIHVNGVCSKKFSFNCNNLKTPRSWGLEPIYQILPSWGQTIIRGLACEIGKFSAARSNTKGFSLKIYGSRKEEKDKF